MSDRATPPGFDKNPTAWPRRIFLAALAFLGLCVSAYLTLFQIEVLPGVWDPLFTSRKVLEFLGFPDASLGVLAYATEIVLIFIGGRERWRTMPWTVLAFGVVIISGALVSALLIAMQAFVVDAWCALCLVSAAISFAIFGFGIDEPLAGVRYLRQVRDSGGSVGRAFWGLKAGKGRDSSA